MSEKTFKHLQSNWISNDIFHIIVQFEYWSSFVALFIIQIVSTVNRSRSQPFIGKIAFKIYLAVIKILFAPGIFIVSVIDYDRLCIYQTVGTFFLDLAFYTNFCIVVILISPYLCSKLGEDSSECVALIVALAALAYTIGSIILYFGIYFGPWVARIENFIGTFGIVVEGVEIFSIHRSS